MVGDWHWWLVTWSTYGSWLPGDERGFRTWRKRELVPSPARYAAADEPTYDPRDYRERRRRSEKITAAAVSLDAEEQRIALDAMVEDIAELPIEPKILVVAATHVHLLAVFGELGVRPTVGRLKSRATRALKPNEADMAAKRVWAKGCHMRSLTTDDARSTAYAYVLKHQSEGRVHEWHPAPKPTALPSNNAAQTVRIAPKSSS